jgi:SAM-dependent methyltransferase
MQDQPFAQADPRWLQLTGDARAWLGGPLGSILHQQSCTLLADELAQYFGGYLVHYGPALDVPVKTEKIRASVFLGAPLPGVQIACEEHAWPLSEHAADLVVLPHALDFCLSPHSLLREAARSVRPGGHLLIIGVNPWSAWGLRKLVARDALRQARCIAPGRLADWLSLLGFALEKRRFGCYRPPLVSAAWQARLAPLDTWGAERQWPLGGVYLLVARKLMLGMRPASKARPESYGKLLPMPVARLSRRDAEQ